MSARAREAGGSVGLPEHCQTCGDLAVRMVVLSVETGSGLAVCEDPERRRVTVETALLGEVSPGQALLVHAGTALALEAG